MRPRPPSLLFVATIVGCAVPSPHDLGIETWDTTESSGSGWSTGPATAADDGSSSGPHDAATPNRCGDGLVGGDEQCDPGPGGTEGPCDERCYVPGNVMWTLPSDLAISDLDVAGERLVICSDAVHLFALGGDAPTELPLDLQPPCERVALAPDGGFATIAWLDEPFDSVLTKYTPAGFTSWSTPSLDFTPQSNTHPDLAVRGYDVVVVGTLGEGIAPRAAEYGPFAELVWTNDFDDSILAELGALFLAASGEVVIGGNLGGGDVSMILALDGVALRYQGVADVSGGYETVRDLAVVDDVILAVIDGDGAAVLASFRPPELTPQWTRLLSPDHGDALALTSHPAGAVVSYVDGDTAMLELIGSDGVTSWSTSWTPMADPSDATIVTDERGDIYLATSDASNEVRAFAAPR